MPMASVVTLCFRAARIFPATMVDCLGATQLRRKNFFTEEA